MNDRSVALMTASYAADFDRCRLLCETMDRHVSGASRHYVLVASGDVAKFRSLETPFRTVVDEADLLPSWLHATQGLERPLWWSLKTWPMRGWHVQQLRRIAIAHHAGEAALLSCDSDMAFVRDYDVSSLWRGDDLRLYRVPDGIDADSSSKHRQWCVNAADLFGLPAPAFPADDYINNLVSWRCADVREMCEAMEEQTGKHWVAAIGSRRTFSECQIYGVWVDRAQNGAGHWHDALPLCRTYWEGAALDEAGLRDFMEGLSEGQVAVGLQSFTGTEPDALRCVLGL